LNLSLPYIIGNQSFDQVLHFDVTCDTGVTYLHAPRYFLGDVVEFEFEGPLFAHGVTVESGLVQLGAQVVEFGFVLHAAAQLLQLLVELEVELFAFAFEVHHVEHELEVGATEGILRVESADPELKLVDHRVVLASLVLVFAQHEDDRLDLVEVLHERLLVPIV